MDARNGMARVLAPCAVAVAILSLAGCRSPLWSELFHKDIEEDVTDSEGEPKGVMKLTNRKPERGEAATPSASDEQRRAIDAMSSPDPNFRAAALRSLSKNHDPRALEFLQKSLDDRNPLVRAAAAAGLAEIGGETVKSVARAVEEHPEEVKRAAANLALDALGVDPQEVERQTQAIAQQTLEVRQAAADTLAQAAGDAQEIRDETVAMAQQLVRDASADVQMRTVEAVSQWPIVKSGPALLVALETGGRETRRAAKARLAKNWPAAASFPVDGDAKQRAAAMAKLRRQWETEH